MAVRYADKRILERLSGQQVHCQDLLNRKNRPQYLVSHLGGRDCRLQCLRTRREGRRVDGYRSVAFLIIVQALPGVRERKEGKKERKDRCADTRIVLGDSGNIFLTVSSLVAAAGMELPSLPANGSMDTTE